MLKKELFFTSYTMYGLHQLIVFSLLIVTSFFKFDIKASLIFIDGLLLIYIISGTFCQVLRKFRFKELIIDFGYYHFDFKQHSNFDL